MRAAITSLAEAAGVEFVNIGGTPGLRGRPWWVAYSRCPPSRSPGRTSPSKEVG
jgi:hypothetical protein